MHVTGRFWTTAALGGALVGLGVLVASPVVLAGALVVAGWLLAAQVAFVRDVRRLHRGAVVDRTADATRVQTDDPVTITVEATLPEATTASVTLSTSTPEALDRVDGTTSASVRPSETTRHSFVLQPAIAGTFEIPPSTLEARDPLGLFSETVPVGEALSIRVTPRTPQNIHVGMGGERAVAAYGEHDAETGQGGIDPAGLRRYVPGDPVKNVDWKVTARLGDLHVREREPRTDQFVALVVDHRQSMTDGPAGQRQLDFAREVALAYLDGARRTGDPLALRTVGDEGLTTDVGAGTTATHYDRVAAVLHGLAPTERPPEHAVDVSTDAATARRRARRLAGSTPFERRLRPYFDAADPYVRRVATDPLVESVTARERRTGEPTLYVLLTDDDRRAELRETLQTVGASNDRALAFVLPDVAFEDATAADLDAAYRRYRDFERFRRELDGLPGITAFEVAPHDHLAAILGRATANTRGATP